MIEFNHNFTNSDHIPQTLQLSDQLSVVTWNILKRCTFYEEPRKFYNNGFGIIESGDEYHIRLRKIASTIKDIVNQNTTVRCIALQEMPVDSDLALFNNYLAECLPNFELMSYKTQGFLFNQNNITVQDTTAELLSKIGKIPHKIQSVTATINGTDINFMNVHLCWFKSLESRVAAINAILPVAQDKTIVLGDFNFNILDVDTIGVKKYTVPNTTLVYNIGNGLQNLETCDGFIICEL